MAFDFNNIVDNKKVFSKDEETNSDIWGQVYQSEDKASGKIEFDLNSLKVKLDPSIEKALNKMLPVFKGDKGVEDQTKLKEFLLDVAKHESKGGKFLKQLGGGPARGAWQIEPKTARDVIETSGLIGPKALKELDKTKEEIKQMSDEEVSSWLLDHKVNAIFAIAKTLQASDHKGKLDYFIKKSKKLSKEKSNN
jgi:hypothetical protein